MVNAGVWRGPPLAATHRALLLLMLLTTAQYLAADPAPTPPNLIVILADDLGAEVLGVYGGQSYATPRLDQMARVGVRFEHGHSQPLCTPSRVMLMTGQHNFRNYRHFGYLDPAQITFAHLLRDAGYDTAVIGKWQLYDNVFQDIRGSLPEDAGFDEYLVWQRNTSERGSRYWGPRLNDNGELVTHPASTFGPDILNAAAREYVVRDRDKPFFLYYPMVLPHSPWVTTPDMLDQQAGTPQRFAAMVTYMDKLVGQLLDTLARAGLENNTVVFFIGDNGTDRDISSLANGREIKGAKGRTLFAGSHVPYLIHGPGYVGREEVSDALVNLADVLPTLLSLAGAEAPDNLPLDGFDLMPILRGEQRHVRDTLLIHYEPRWPTALPARYAFDQRYKLYDSGAFYDGVLDPGEQVELAPQDLAGRARAAYQELSLRLDSAPGELRSRQRWLPRQFYYAVAIAVTMILLVGWLAVRLIRAYRKNSSRTTSPD